MKKKKFFTKLFTVLLLLSTIIGVSQTEVPQDNIEGTTTNTRGDGDTVGPENPDCIGCEEPMNPTTGCLTSMSVDRGTTINAAKLGDVFVYTINSFCRVIDAENVVFIKDLGNECSWSSGFNLIKPNNTATNALTGITVSTNTIKKWVTVGHHEQREQYQTTIRLTIENNSNKPERTFEIKLPLNDVNERGAASSQFFSDHIFFIKQPGDAGYHYYYSDVDGDSFGDCEEERVSSNVAITGKVTNSSDKCPFEFSKGNEGCMDANESRNWIKSKGFDITGSEIGSVKNYYNDLGKLEQSQSYDVKYKRIWASHTLFDAQGRPALQSMGAPLTAKNKTEGYKFKENFIKKDNGEVFTTNDLETISADDSPKISKTSDLGKNHYNNVDEVLQDNTERPYSRTIYSELMPGAVKQTIGGNKIKGEWKRGYSFSMPAAQEMYYVYGYNYFESNPSIAATYENIETILTNTNYKINWLKAGKTVIQDVKEDESVIFTDADGKTLGAARSGGEKKYEVLSLIGEQKYIDIHIPMGCDGTASLLGNSSNYKVYDLKTELPNGDISKAGFYRVEYIGNTELTKNHTLTYIDKRVTDKTDKVKPVMSDAVGVRYNVNYYDFSLNYYNVTGQLTASLQPLGFDGVCLDELSATVTHNENLKSEFTYNSLGQLVQTKSPDEGEAWFKYRKDGQIRFSQNSKQIAASPKEFSYTNYDALGRPIESGVAAGVFSNLNPENISFSATKKKEQHFTEYDYLVPKSQTELNKLVSTTYRNPTFLSGNVARTYNTDDSGTIITESYYSYDVYGRVKWIVQNLGEGLGAKTIDYVYDPITSQVLEVIYQKESTIGEKFVHRYAYDADTQQLIKIETASGNNPFITHADYTYYENSGALKRTEIAGGIQGIDYVYNLAGQLKAINHPNLNKESDPGGDDNDLFGMTLDYYTGDYQRNTTAFTFPVKSKFKVSDQYTGNIKAITWNTNVEGKVSSPFQYNYKYDRNNWLKEANFDGMGSEQANPSEILKNKLYSSYHAKATSSITLKEGFEIKATSSVTFTAKIIAGGSYADDDYKVSNITYDVNGNIESLDRNKNTEKIDGADKNEMDKLRYKYKIDKPNQLLRVDDLVEGATNADDIKDQDGTNYTYNAIGQLTDNAEENVKYEYNASGLVTLVKYYDKDKVRFYYNDKNFRTKKISYLDDGTTEDKVTVYVRDAAGSTLAIYEDGVLKELPIYGASRLGVYNKETESSVYQLTDHLGNVRAVIAKKGSQAVAILNSATDYYPGGMAMPNRQIVNGEPYRYGYQGEFAETDPETGKPAFQLRLYDPRINRWLSPDPMGQYDSPYMSMDNRWNMSVDPTGGCTGKDCNHTHDGGTLDEINITGKGNPLMPIGMDMSIFNTSFTPSYSFIPTPINPLPKFRPIGQPGPGTMNPPKPPNSVNPGRTGVLFLWALFYTPDTNPHSPTNAPGVLYPRDLRDIDDLARIRVQLQSGHDDIVPSQKAYNKSQIGVTVLQGEVALSSLATSLSTHDRKLFKSREFGNAMTKLEKKMRSLPPSGIIGGTRTTLQEAFIFKNRKYRVDVESIGHNFRQ